MRSVHRRTIGDRTGDTPQVSARNGTQDVPVRRLFVTHKTPHRKGKSASVITRMLLVCPSPPLSKRVSADIASLVLSPPQHRLRSDLWLYRWPVGRRLPGQEHGGEHVRLPPLDRRHE